MDLEPNQAEAIERFKLVAARYCALVEGEPCDPEAEMRTLARLLAELYLNALDLPDMDNALDESASPPVRSSSHSYEKAVARFARLPLESYWDVFDPLAPESEEPVYNSLVDDLGGVYSDLERGFELLAHEGIGAAAWEWRFHFICHWGNHLVGAQRAIFLWLAGQTAA